MSGAELPASSKKVPGFHSKLPYYREDYSQYKPRGHYTANDELKGCFRLMTHYGRKTFSIMDDSATLSAILITHTLRDLCLFDDWESIDAFFDYVVGESDDWTPRRYSILMDEVFGKVRTIEEYSDGEKIKRFQRLASERLPLPRIVAMQPGPEPDPERRRREIDGYETEINRIQSAYSAYGENVWQETLYNSWLHVFKSLFAFGGSRQKFMSSSEWGLKSLNAALASWTELRHDTLLYVKQSYGEGGSGGDEGPAAPFMPPLPKGYVEPNPVFFERLSRLTKNTLRVLGESGFLTEEYSEKLTLLEKLVGRTGALALKELSGTDVTLEDYTWIRDLPGYFDRRLLLPKEIYLRNPEIDPDLLKSALVADVATDAENGKVLVEGVGYPMRIAVLVKDYRGGTRIAEGYVYRHYEFISDRRRTDEEWKTMVYDKHGQTELNTLEHEWYRGMLIR